MEEIQLLPYKEIQCSQHKELASHYIVKQKEQKNVFILKFSNIQKACVDNMKKFFFLTETSESNLQLT